MLDYICIPRFQNRSKISHKVYETFTTYHLQIGFLMIRAAKVNQNTLFEGGWDIE